MVNKICVILGVVSVLVLCLWLSKCGVPDTPPVIPITDEVPIVSVTPQSPTAAVLAVVPDAVSQINIPAAPVVLPGQVASIHVVHDSVGNTLVVATTKVDIGFRVVPKYIIGYTGDPCLGLGVEVFRYGRYNTDVVGLIDLQKQLSIGLGVAYSITHNTSVGVMGTLDTELNKKLGVYVGIRM